jgi:hypothetical protein
VLPYGPLPKFGMKSRTFSRSRRKMSHQCAEVTVSLARTNSIVNNLYDVKENYEHALHFALRLSRFSVCPKPSLSFKHPCRAHAFFLECLSDRCPGLRSTFPTDSHKIWCCSVVGSIVKSHQARYTTTNNMTKISTLKQLRKMLYNDSQEMLVLSLTVAWAAATAVQMAEPVPEIMDTTLYIITNFLCWAILRSCKWPDHVPCRMAG